MQPAVGWLIGSEEGQHEVIQGERYRNLSLTETLPTPGSEKLGA